MRNSSQWLTWPFTPNHTKSEWCFGFLVWAKPNSGKFMCTGQGHVGMQKHKNKIVLPRSLKMAAQKHDF